MAIMTFNAEEDRHYVTENGKIVAYAVERKRGNLLNFCKNPLHCDSLLQFATFGDLEVYVKNI